MVMCDKDWADTANVNPRLVHLVDRSPSRVKQQQVGTDFHQHRRLEAVKVFPRCAGA